MQEKLKPFQFIRLLSGERVQIQDDETEIESWRGSSPYSICATIFQQLGFRDPENHPKFLDCMVEVSVQHERIRDTLERTNDNKGECSQGSSGGQFAVLKDNVIAATILVPAFIAGQFAYSLIGAPRWELCFGLCLGG